MLSWGNWWGPCVVDSITWWSYLNHDACVLASIVGSDRAMHRYFFMSLWISIWVLMLDVWSFLAIPSKDVCSSRAPGRPDRSSCGGCRGHAGPKPPNRGGKKDHPLCHGSTEKRRGERAVYVEVSRLNCHLLHRADRASKQLTSADWQRSMLQWCWNWSLHFSVLIYL